MATTNTNRARYFRPVYIDNGGSPCYVHTGYALTAAGALLAHFADGSVRPSVFPTFAALEAAARVDYRERFREVEAL